MLIRVIPEQESQLKEWQKKKNYQVYSLKIQSVVYCFPTVWRNTCHEGILHVLKFSEVFLPSFF